MSNEDAGARATGTVALEVAAGSRTPLVMIHGLLGSIDYFDPARYLDGLAVHTPDLSGYGTNPQADATIDAQPLTLSGQARHIADYLRQQVRAPAWLLGHSVGGAVAMLAAAQAPEHVLGVISVEGNFTLDDAFWCRQIAPLYPAEWSARYQAIRSDESAWLKASGIAATPERLEWARHILSNQPAATVHAMARAVVTETGHPDFLACVRKLVDAGLPIGLLSGESSRPDWNVPPWVQAAALRDAVLPGGGHMMMLESPTAFCRAVQELVEVGSARRAGSR
ncbi:MAG: alpha/beta hydrolase [Rhizobacter sp.]|nr:alpha/beta hydrolase [Rhizobacter sp.]